MQYYDDGIYLKVNDCTGMWDKCFKTEKKSYFYIQRLKFQLSKRTTERIVKNN